MKNFLKFIGKNLVAFIVIITLIIVALFAGFAGKNSDGTRTFNGDSPKYTAVQEQNYCEGVKSNDKAIAALSGIDVPQDATSGCNPTDLGQYGSLAYYQVGMASPSEFYNSVNGKGFNEGYGYQCVAAFKEFQYSLSGKYIAAAGGGAKGYATQQTQIEPLGFKWFSGTSGIKDGDWAIWTNGQYGHVAMYYQGKFFSQNQYAADPNVGNPFNLASVSMNGIAGFYRPNIYKDAAPVDPGTPTNPGNPSVTPPATSSSYTTRKGDTLGGISLGQGWWVGTNGLYGDSGYAQRLADFNGISPRGLIYPNQVIKRAE
ncbi:MAG: LysM peptidoglycan-binding domain-containing protein [Candidatus Saccharimonadaceae bacterium]